jgi:hypothetical protein
LRASCQCRPSSDTPPGGSDGLTHGKAAIVTGFRAGVGVLGTGRDFDGGCGEAEASAVGCVCVPRLPA